MSAFCLALSRFVVGIALAVGFLAVIGIVMILFRQKKQVPEGPNRREKSSKQTMPTMFALRGRRFGPSSECQAKCLKCGQQIVFLLSGRPIRGKRAQLVYKHECNQCGQSLYATTCTTEISVLATYCCIVDGQMRIDNAVELKIEDAANATLGGSHLVPTPLVVGRGQDGKTALLGAKDIERIQI